MAEDAARELPNLTLEDACSSSICASVAMPGMRSNGTGWSIQAMACPVSLAGSAPMSSSSPTM